MSAPAILTVQDLGFRYGRTCVLAGVSIDVRAGELVALVGPNGAGKSTALACIAGPETLGGRRYRGHITLAGRAASTLAARDRAQLVGYLPQNLPADLALTVEELVWLGRHPHLGAFGARTQVDTEAVAQAVESCELGPLRHRPTSALSGGERQRAYLASALSGAPSLLLLDEPTSALDLRHALGLLRILRTGTAAVLMATHDLNLAARNCDRIAVLAGGELQAFGTPDEVLTSDLLRNVYGVTATILRDPATGRPIVLADEIAP
jgi:iron complex transport system ATP-binding protein